MLETGRFGVFFLLEIRIWIDLSTKSIVYNDTSKASTISNCYENLYAFLSKNTYVWLDQIHKLEPHWITPYILKSMMRTDRQQEWVPRRYKMPQDLENTLADRWTCFRIFFMHFNFYFGVQPPPPSQKKNTKKRDSSAVTPFFFYVFNV